MKRIIPLTVLFTVVLVAAMAALPVFGAGNGGDGLETARAAQERHTDGLMKIEGVEGTAVGHGPEGKGAVFVFAATRGVKGVPGKLDGVPVITHVTGEFSALHHRNGHSGGPGGDEDPPTEPTGECATTERCERPVPIGVSTGHPSITAGTIAARVTDGNEVYALSNNHVHAASNSASIGDDVIQPGTSDGGSAPGDTIGTLADFHPIIFGNDDCLVNANVDCNTIDAAISLTTTALLGNSTLSDGYGTPGSQTTTLGINDKVRKYGRTTNQTKGFVWALNAIVDVNYGPPGVARFEDQIVFKGQGPSFSAGGDSGSLIVTQKGGNQPASLLFAGSSQFTIGNPIDAVVDRFGVTIDGSP